MLAGQFTEPFAGVVVAPRTDPQYPIIATAWRVMIRFERYDRATLDAFVDLFRGRGPEDPVR